MIILGIETSCDDTSLAIVENGTKVLAYATASQVAVHNKTGGVVPEIAAREHVRVVVPVYAEVLRQAKLHIEQIDAIAVTQGPGLVSSLLIGDLLASTIGLVHQKPVIPVHHIEGHIYGNWLERAEQDFQFPIMILTASGGHNELILMRGHGQYAPIGHTRDDAAGEAFDKVARILGLSYPGGPAIAQAAELGDASRFKLPRPWLPGTYEFSFSGLKSEALRIVEKEIRDKKRLSQQFVRDLAASFQQCMVEVLAGKLFRATEDHRVREVHIAGGVSANKLLRTTVERMAKTKGLHIKFPTQIRYSTDNGAMIAACGYFRGRKNLGKFKKWRTILPEPNLALFPR